MYRKLLFIYNPNSGKQLISRKLADIIKVFSDGGYEVTCHPTRSQGDCMLTVSERAKYYDMVVAAGGDGTLNEAVNGFMNKSCGYSKPFGYIPCGSTNDFSHSLGIPIKPVMAAKSIVSGIPFEFDVGKLNERYFTYVAGFGTLTEVSYSTPQDSKNLLGFAAYILNGISALPTIQSFNISFESKERSGSGEYLLGLVTNTLHVAGFKSPIAADVLLNDGMFEVLLVRKPKNITDINAIAECLFNRNFDNKCIDYFKTSKISISCDRPVSYTLDGENGGEHTLAVIENYRKPLSVMIDGSIRSLTYTDTGSDSCSS